MTTHRWIIDMRDMQYKYNMIRAKGFEKTFMKGSKVWATHFRNQKIDRQKYYEGFNVGREKTMFQDELKDLEIQYKDTLVNLHKKVEDCLPSLLYYMEEFVTLHKHNEAIREKLDALLEKLGRPTSEETDGGDDNE